MTRKSSTDVPRTEALRNEATRQRWDLFHRAIAHAKQSNDSALQHDSDEAAQRAVSFESFAS
ncbi:MAG: hypothetical protein WBM54_04150 [Woeseia sp.]